MKELSKATILAKELICKMIDEKLLDFKKDEYRNGRKRKEFNGNFVKLIQSRTRMGKVGKGRVIATARLNIIIK